MSTTQRYLWTTLTTVVVLAGVGIPLLVRGASGKETPSAAAPDPGVTSDHHYYVLLSVVEVAPHKKEEKKRAWDFDGSAPDLYYEILWQGHRVFKSTRKPDTLLAKWSNVAVGIGDLVNSVSLDESIQAARITVRDEEELEFVVYDADFGRDDLVGRWKVAMKDLQVGDQRWEAPAGRVVSAECRVLPLDDVKFDSLTK